MNFDDEHRKDFTTKDHRKVVIRLDDEGEGIEVRDADGGEIGRFEIQRIEDGSNDYYYITWMHIEPASFFRTSKLLM